MADLAGRPALRHIIDRLRAVEGLDGVVVATTDLPEDAPIRDCARDAGVPCYSGSSEDVLGRTLAAARSVGARTIVQITGDCPMIDPAVTARVLSAYRDVRPDYASNVLSDPLTYPGGLDTEVFSTELLDEVDRLTSAPEDREHVSLYIYRHPERYRLHSVEATGDERRPDLWFSLDTPQDYAGIRAVFEALYPANPLFSFRDVLSYLEDHPEVAELNSAGARA